MKWVRYWRRRWCMWRNHPMASWSQVVMYWPPRYVWVMEDNSIKGDSPEIMVRAWRCAKHDKQEAK